jgi:hypothetical protein
MSFVRSALVAAILGVVTPALALAQTPMPSSSASFKIDDVYQQMSTPWNRAKAEWDKERERWSDCQKRSIDHHLTGRKNWSFLASCTMPSISSAIDDVSRWTSKEWRLAKAKWIKEKQKWDDCRRRSGDQPGARPARGERKWLGRKQRTLRESGLRKRGRGKFRWEKSR